MTGSAVTGSGNPVTMDVHDAGMSDVPEFTIDCRTCIGSGTTACNDCVMTHLLANDAGPIDYVTIGLQPVPRLPEPDEVAIDLFRRAGMVADPVEFVTQDEFDRYGALIR